MKVDESLKSYSRKDKYLPVVMCIIATFFEGLFCEKMADYAQCAQLFHIKT